MRTGKGNPKITNLPTFLSADVFCERPPSHNYIMNLTISVRLLQLFSAIREIIGLDSKPKIMQQKSVNSYWLIVIDEST